MLQPRASRQPHSSAADVTSTLRAPWKLWDVIGKHKCTCWKLYLCFECPRSGSFFIHEILAFLLGEARPNKGVFPASWFKYPQGTQQRIEILLIRDHFSKKCSPCCCLAQGHMLSGWWTNRSANFQQSEELKSNLTSVPTLVFDTVKTIICFKATADYEWGSKRKLATKWDTVCFFLKLDYFLRKRSINNIN